MLMGKFCEEFVGMLQGFDDLMGINDSPAPAVIQTGDLVFISETIEGSGFIGIVDEGDGKPTCQRVYIEGDTVKLCTMTHFSDVREVPRDTVKICGRVTGFYRKLEDTPLPADGLEDTPLYKAISKVRPGGFDIKWGEIQTIKERNRGYPFGCILDGFLYGFLKGQRAERARVKKKGMKQHGEAQSQR